MAIVSDERKQKLIERAEAEVTRLQDRQAKLRQQLGDTAEPLKAARQELAWLRGEPDPYAPGQQYGPQEIPDGPGPA